jgi:DNA-binding Xre family transcriptional regulator
MQIRMRVREYLQEHKITPKKLVASLQGRVAQASVYALLRADRVKRVDLHTLSGVLSALESITGKAVEIGELLEKFDDQPDDGELQKLVNSAPVTSWDSLKALMGSFSANELVQDDLYWQSRTSRRSELLAKEATRAAL